MSNKNLKNSNIVQLAIQGTGFPRITSGPQAKPSTRRGSSAAPAIIDGVVPFVGFNISSSNGAINNKIDSPKTSSPRSLQDNKLVTLLPDNPLAPSHIDTAKGVAIKQKQITGSNILIAARSLSLAEKHAKHPKIPKVDPVKQSGLETDSNTEDKYFEVPSTVDSTLTESEIPSNRKYKSNIGSNYRSNSTNHNINGLEEGPDSQIHRERMKNMRNNDDSVNTATMPTSISDSMTTDDDDVTQSKKNEKMQDVVTDSEKKKKKKQKICVITLSVFISVIVLTVIIVTVAFLLNKSSTTSYVLSISAFYTVEDSSVVFYDFSSWIDKELTIFSPSYEEFSEDTKKKCTLLSRCQNKTDWSETITKLGPSNIENYPSGKYLFDFKLRCLQDENSYEYSATVTKTFYLDFDGPDVTLSETNVEINSQISLYLDGFIGSGIKIIYIQREYESSKSEFYEITDVNATTWFAEENDKYIGQKIYDLKRFIKEGKYNFRLVSGLGLVKDIGSVVVYQLD